MLKSTPMSYLPDHSQGKLNKPNRKAIQERNKRKGKIAGVSGAGNRLLARIIVAKSTKIRKNARINN